MSHTLSIATRRVKHHVAVAVNGGLCVAAFTALSATRGCLLPQRRVAAHLTSTHYLPPRPTAVWHSALRANSCHANLQTHEKMAAAVARAVCILKGEGVLGTVNFEQVRVVLSTASMLHCDAYLACTAAGERPP